MDDLENQSMDSPEDESHINETLSLVSELSLEGQLKLEVIQSLLEPCDRSTYGERLGDGARKLGVSVRSVQRLFKQYQQEGNTALISSQRSDNGKHRISSSWQDFIIKTYKKGNEGSKRMNPKQVALRVEAEAYQRKEENFPSYRTVLRVLEPILAKLERAKSIRSPGWQGSDLSVKTRDGQDLEVKHSNQVWQCDHTRADILLVDKHGEVIGRPWLTTVIDSYSRCIMGINLGFDDPSSQVVALALRHAILPKKYGAEFQLNCQWSTYGKPSYLFTDGGKDFRSNHLAEISTQLALVLKLRDRPSEGGIIERPFKTLNQNFFSTLLGYTGSNVQERPKDAEKDAKFTLQEIEQLIVRYIVDRYNQSIDARMGDQTRYQRWEAGFKRAPEIISQRELDICLMKAARRTVQRGGCLQFENILYKGEYLAGFEGETMSIRYDPRDITTIWIYRQEKGKEVFLTRAHAQGLETEKLTLNEAKSSTKRLREKGKSLNNESILREVIERESVVNKKKTRKQKQQEEQAYKPSQPLSVSEKKVQTEEIEAIETQSTIQFDEDIEVWDLEDLRRNY